MASQILNQPLYLLPRTALWILLFVAAVLDGLRHLSVNARARKLYIFVVAVLGLFAVQDVLLLVYSLTGGSERGTSVIFSIYIFFTDLADSSFNALLLVVAAGFCITRDDLGPYKLKCTLIPTVYFVTILVVDYIMDAVKGRQAFSVVDFDEPQQSQQLNLPEWQNILLVVCAFVNLLALMAAWIYVFDTIQKEREMLEQPEQDVYGMAEAGQLHAHPRPEGEQPSGIATGETDAGAGHAVSLPPDAVGDPDAMPNTYGEVTVEDLDGPKTVEEKVARLAKIRLLKQFQIGVIAYVLATAAVVLLPIFVSNKPGKEAFWAVLILQNLVLWGFMASLAFIFRLRGDSPYLMLDEEEGAGANNDSHLETQLGVLGEDDEEANGRHSPAGSQGSMDNFSLHDIDEDDVQAARQHAPSQAPDDKAEAPKAPMLAGMPRSDE